MRFHGLDRARLAGIADRIGFTMEERKAETPAEPQDLIDSFELGSGYLKPSEGGTRLQVIEETLHEDVLGVGASV